jgi:hypothetical protein
MSSKSRSAGKPSSYKEPSVKADDDNNSLDRDEDDNYSNDFISESIPSGSMVSSSKTMLQSVKALQQKAAEIEDSGYT